MSTNHTSPDTSSTPTGCCGGELPGPAPEHQWLQRLVGEWEATVEISAGPGKEPMKSHAINRVRALGGFWVIEEGRNDAMQFSFMLTLGYEADRRKYVGTWVDTMIGHLWVYEGTLDATGDVLTMETEGPSPAGDGTTTRFRDVTTFRSPDHRVYTSSIQSGGRWQPMLTVDLRRRK